MTANDCRHLVRTLALPLLALAVVAALCVTGRLTAEEARSLSACGPVVTVRDPELRRSFARFDREQSAAAREICAIYAHNDVTGGPALVARMGN